jgi:hypothetical protein
VLVAARGMIFGLSAGPRGVWVIREVMSLPSAF